MDASHNPSTLKPKLLRCLHRALNSLNHCVELAPSYGIEEGRLNNVVAAWTRWHDRPAALVFLERLAPLAGGPANLALLIAHLDGSALLRSTSGPSHHLHLVPFRVWVDPSRSYVR